MNAPDTGAGVEGLVASIEGRIASGRPVVASVAPSFPGAFPGIKPGQFFAGLKALGFGRVEETASVLPVLVGRTRALLRRTPTVISASCPVVVEVVKTRYPGALRFLSTLPSPMALHAGRLKEKAGARAFVVFIGPCHHKRREAVARRAPVDAALTFSEVKAWFETKGVELERMPAEPLDPSVPNWARLSVLVDGINGLERCKRFLSLVSMSPPSGYHELLACEGGCLGGPGIGSLATMEERRSAVFRMVWENEPEVQGENESHGQVLPLCPRA